MSWMQTYTGIPFELTNISKDLIHFEDIVVSLSRQVRFNGHTKKPITIAQHSVLVAEMVMDAGGSDELILAALLHDGHEAYMSDIPSPIKWALGDNWKPFKEVEAKIDAAISERFGIDVSLFSDPLLKHADGSALWHEKEALLEDWGHMWQWDLILGDNIPLPDPNNMDLTDPWDSTQAKREFSSFLTEYENMKISGSTT